jgi:holo-[acyl-carrier protein] synthase
MIVGLGIDLVDIARVERMIVRKGERMLARLFTEDERAYCSRMHSPAKHFAVRLAAKEAAFKALSGTIAAREIGWSDMEVVTDTHGRPALRLLGRAAARATELGVVRTHLSLTHSDASAGAVVILEADG